MKSTSTSAAACLFDTCNEVIQEKWVKVAKVGLVRLEDLPERMREPAMELVKETVRRKWRQSDFMPSPDVVEASKLRSRFDQLLRLQGLEGFTANPTVTAECLATCLTIMAAVFFSKPPLTFSTNHGLEEDFDCSRHQPFDGAESCQGKTKVIFPSMLEANLPALSTSIRPSKTESWIMDESQ